jgi:phosphate-selective porin OprO/OprP
MEDRLRRMEESYARMEEVNRQIQSNYDALLKKFDVLSLQMSQSKAAATDSAKIKTIAKQDAASAGSGNTDNDAETTTLMPLDTLEEETMDNFIAPYFQQSGLGAQGRVRRGSPTEGPNLGPQLPRGESRLDRSGLGAEGTGHRRDFAPASDGGNFPFGRSRMDRIGAGAQGTDGRVSPDQQPTPRGARGEERRQFQETVGEDQRPFSHPAKVEFAEGLEFVSDDGEFALQFHNLTQSEFRGFPNRIIGTLQDQFFIPRQRWYFTGDLTKHMGFYTVVNRSYGSFDLLDAFVGIRANDQLKIRIGRMKTPYLYEYFSIAEGDLIAPERSLFAGNLSANREIGALFLGEVFKSRLSYAVGLYNGPRNSFGDFNSAKDVMGIINSRPFLESPRFEALKYFNIGASWDVGYQNNNPPQPTYFETANDQTSGNQAIGVSPTFLHLNNNVIELGKRTQWGTHLVWFYKSLLLMAEYGGARDGYSFVNSTNSTPINFSGYHVTASYFLTGEQLTRRVNVVQPRRDFTFDFLKGGTFNPGAWELFARYSTFEVGRNIFTGGFADPNLWSNHVWTTDIGANWYLNFYTRIFFDWQHSEFGNPVTVAPGKFSSTADLFWLRFQIFF